MENDERLIREARDLFNRHSIFEIIDIEDQAEVIRTMIEIYNGGVDLVKVQQYLDVLDRLRKWKGQAENRTAISKKDNLNRSDGS